MNINIRNYQSEIQKFQEGGAMPAEAAPEAAPMEAAPAEEAPQGGGDPVMELAQMAMQALQGQDCEAAMAVCEGFVQLVQEMAGGGAAGAPGAAPEGEPVYRRGGKLVGYMNY